MVRKEIVDYIEKELNKGAHIDRIRNALLEVGHNVDHVHEAVKHVQKKKRRTGNFVMIIPIIFVALLIGSFFLFVNEKDVSGVIISDNNSDSQVIQQTTEQKEIDTIVNNPIVHKETDDEKIDRALLSQALRTKDETLCPKIMDEGLRNSCYRFIK